MGLEEHRAVQGSALGLHCQEELSGSITAERGGNASSKNPVAEVLPVACQSRLLFCVTMTWTREGC